MLKYGWDVLALRDYCLVSGGFAPLSVGSHFVVLRMLRLLVSSSLIWLVSGLVHTQQVVKVLF